MAEQLQSNYFYIAVWINRMSTDEMYASLQTGETKAEKDRKG